MHCKGIWINLPRLFCQGPWRPVGGCSVGTGVGDADEEGKCPSLERPQQDAVGVQGRRTPELGLESGVRMDVEVLQEGWVLFQG